MKQYTIEVYLEGEQYSLPNLVERLDAEPGFGSADKTELARSIVEYLEDDSGWRWDPAAGSAQAEMTFNLEEDLIDWEDPLAEDSLNEQLTAYDAPERFEETLESAIRAKLRYTTKNLGGS